MNFLSSHDRIRGYALDIIVLASNQSFASSDFHLVFEGVPVAIHDEVLLVELQINQQQISPSFFSMKPLVHSKHSWNKSKSSAACRNITYWMFNNIHATKPSSTIWKQLVDDGKLLFGSNHIRFLLCHVDNCKEDGHSVLGYVDSLVFLWRATDRFIITDIDGTITKSNAIGVWDSILTTRYQHVHSGTCQFFSKILSDQLRVIYLSSRPSFLIQRTRHFITTLQQQSVHSDDDQTTTHALPRGPIILQNESLLSILPAEVITHSSFIFKAHALRKYILHPWYEVSHSSRGRHGEDDSNKDVAPILFVAAFGNTRSDYLAYRQVGISSSNIFIIDEKSKIRSEIMKGHISDDGESSKTWNSQGMGMFHRCFGSIYCPSNRHDQGSVQVEEYQGYYDPCLHEKIKRNVVNAFQ